MLIEHVHPSEPEVAAHSVWHSPLQKFSVCPSCVAQQPLAGAVVHYSTASAPGSILSSCMWIWALLGCRLGPSHWQRPNQRATGRL